MCFVCVQLRLLPQEIGHLALQEAATVYMFPQCSSISMVAYLVIFDGKGPPVTLILCVALSDR